MNILLHPPTVHFPVALLLIGSIIELNAARWPSLGLQQAAAVMLRIGWWSCLLALATGLASIALDWGFAQQHLGLINAHAATALLLTGLYWRIVIARPPLVGSTRRRLLSLGIACILGVGWLGGRLVEALIAR